MSHQASITLLKFASLTLIGFGLLMVSALFTPTAAVMHHLVDLAFLPFDGAQSVSSPEGWLLTAISGGMLVGWGTMAWLVTDRVYAKDVSAGRNIILPGILAWFLFDSLGSILAGAWFNTVLNAGFLALFAVPILLQRPATSVERA